MSAVETVPTRRLTKQRSLIWAVLTQAGGRHLSVAEVETEVREGGSPLHRATIYRTLDRLVDDGFLVRTNLGPDRSTYEIAEVHHHHLVCGECGRTEHVSHELVRAAVARIEQQSGFDLAMAQLILHGRCHDCRTKP